VAVGMSTFRYHLAHQPGKAVALDEYLDRTEHVGLGIAGSQAFLKPVVILAAGSVDRDRLAAGSRFARRWYTSAVEEYFERAAAVGLPRRERSRLPRLDV